MDLPGDWIYHYSPGIAVSAGINQNCSVVVLRVVHLNMVIVLISPVQLLVDPVPSNAI